MRTKRILLVLQFKRISRSHLPLQSRRMCCHPLASLEGNLSSRILVHHTVSSSLPNPGCSLRKRKTSGTGWSVLATHPSRTRTLMATYFLRLVQGTTPAPQHFAGVRQCELG